MLSNIHFCFTALVTPAFHSHWSRVFSRPTVGRCADLLICRSPEIRISVGRLPLFTPAVSMERQTRIFTTADLALVQRQRKHGCQKTVRESLEQFFGSRAFSVAAPTVWNSLPDNVVNSDTLAMFKKRLKTHLFSQCHATERLCISYYGAIQVYVIHSFIHSFNLYTLAYPERWLAPLNLRIIFIVGIICSQKLCCSNSAHHIH